MIVQNIGHVIVPRASEIILQGLVQALLTTVAGMLLLCIVLFILQPLRHIRRLAIPPPPPSSPLLSTSRVHPHQTPQHTYIHTSTNTHILEHTTRTMSSAKHTYLHAHKHTHTQLLEHTKRTMSSAKHTYTCTPTNMPTNTHTHIYKSTQYAPCHLPGCTLQLRAETVSLSAIMGTVACIDNGTQHSLTSCRT